MFANIYRVNSNVTLNASNLLCSYAGSIHSGGFEAALSPGHRQTQGVEPTRRWETDSRAGGSRKPPPTAISRHPTS
jgi:hypothetical protein